jgi:hypothetical protein
MPMYLRRPWILQENGLKKLEGMTAGWQTLPYERLAGPPGHARRELCKLQPIVSCNLALRWAV